MIVKIGRELTITKAEVARMIIDYMESKGLPAPDDKSIGLNFEMRGESVILSWVDEREQPA